MLGPYVNVQSSETLRRLLADLGATPAQLAEFDSCERRWELLSTESAATFAELIVFTQFS